MSRLVKRLARHWPGPFLAVNAHVGEGRALEVDEHVVVDVGIGLDDRELGVLGVTPMRRFARNFMLLLLAFGIANVVSYFVRTDMPGAADAIRRAGFPFLVWEEGGFSYRYSFSHAALWADIGVAVGVSAIGGVWLSRLAR